jgi:hypothetical protein
MLPMFLFSATATVLLAGAALYLTVRDDGDAFSFR